MPAVTRVGDRDLPHCSGMTRAAGSGNVTVNGRPVSRQGDNNTGHLLPGDPCPGHAAPIAAGSPTVTVNGRGIGRVGDAISGCTRVAEGSPDVTSGSGTGGIDPPPARPADVMATPGAGALQVSWAAVAGADGYKVQWKSGDQAFSPDREAEVTGTGYTITGLEGETAYGVRVIATRENALDGPPSATVTATPETPRQTVTGTLPGSSFVGIPTIYALWGGATFATLPGHWFASGNPTALRDVRLTASGRIELSFGGGFQDNLTADARENTQLTIATAQGSVTVDGIGGTDTTDPYSWAPPNSDEVLALYNAIVRRRRVAGTIAFSGPAA